jgi:hypothetical protein
VSGGYWSGGWARYADEVADERARSDGSPSWTHGFPSAEAWLAYEPVPAPAALRALSADVTEEPRPRSLLDRITQALRRR